MQALIGFATGESWDAFMFELAN